MAECWNTICGNYQDQPSCHDGCRLFTRAVREEASPQRPSEFYIWNKKVYAVPPNTFLLFDSLDLKPSALDQGAGQLMTIGNLNKTYTGIIKEPAFQSLSSNIHLLTYHNRLYIPADINRHSKCPIYLRLLWHPDEANTLCAADLVLMDLVKRMVKNGNCLDCATLSSRTDLLQMDMDTNIKLLLQAGLEKQEATKKEAQARVGNVPSLLAGMPPVDNVLVQQMGLKWGLIPQLFREKRISPAVTGLNWPASFPPLPQEFITGLGGRVPSVRELIPYLPVQVEERYVRLMQGQIEVAVLWGNGNNNIYSWIPLERAIEIQMKSEAKKV